MVDQIKVKTRVGPRRARSATAPRAIIGVMAANMSWKTQKAMEGMRGLPIEGPSRTPLRPKYSGRGGKKVKKTVIINVEEKKKQRLTEVTDVCAASLTEGERETPKEPLERDHGKDHHGKPNHGEGVLAAEEARVEEADAGDHDPDECGGGEDPCYVAWVVDDVVTGDEGAGCGGME
jgi:hypothetical protein